MVGELRAKAEKLKPARAKAERLKLVDGWGVDS
jgi:hypothetical protein